MSTAKTKRKARFKVAQVGLKFDQSDRKKRHDMNALFSRGYDWITGTEAGPGAGNSQDLLKEYAKKYGYELNVSNRYGTWVAVKKTLIYNGLYKSQRFGLLGSKKMKPKPPGKFGDKGIVYIKWNLGSVFGTVSVGAAHFVTQSAVGTRAKKLSLDKAYTKRIEKWRLAWAKKKTVSFIGLDANWNDKKYDVFQGASKFITCWDELRTYPKQGTADTRLDQVISAICRARSSTRARCVSAKVLDDKALFLNTDHYVIEAVYELDAVK